MLQGLPRLLLFLLLEVVWQLARLVTGVLLPSMVHFTVQHRSNTLPPEENTHASVRAKRHRDYDLVVNFYLLQSFKTRFYDIFELANVQWKFYFNIALLAFISC